MIAEFESTSFPEESSVLTVKASVVFEVIGLIMPLVTVNLMIVPDATAVVKALVILMYLFVES